MQCMVHSSRPWVDLIRCSLNQSERLPTPLRKVGLLSSHSEPWIDAKCSLKIEHPGCAENQALANHPCSVEQVLLHALVKYTIQLALQNTFSSSSSSSSWWSLGLEDDVVCASLGGTENLCGKVFKVGEPLNGGNPTLSAMDVGFQ